MSMIDGLTSLKKERAKLERDRVVLGSMVEDACMSNLIFDIYDDDSTYLEGVEDDDSMDALIDKIPESDEEEEEVERILKSKDDMDVDDILGIEEE